MGKQKTVEYKGKFDTSGIIDGLKRIRNELSKTVSSNEGKSALGNIDKQLAQLEKSSILIKSALDKGFTSTSEMKAFEKELDKIYSGALLIKNGLQAVSRTEVKINTKESLKELEKLEKEIELLKGKALKELLRVIDSSKFSDKSTLKMLALQGKLTKENLETEVEERKEVLKQLKALLEATKELLILSEKLKLAESSIKKGKINASPFTSENISSLVKYRNNAWKDYDTSIRLRGKTQYTNKFTDNADIVLNSVYAKSLKLATISAKSETDALGILTDALSKYNIALKEGSALANTFKQSWAKIVTSEDVSNINAATIARNKAITSQEKAIEKTRMEIVLYSLIADAVDEYENELSEADSKLEKFTNDAIKNNAALESIDNEAEHLGNNINEWGDAVHTTSEGLKETTERLQRLNDTFDGMKTAVVTLLSIGNIFMQMRLEISKTYEDIKELDKAFGLIAMVTEFSIEDMWNKYEAYAKIANELGQSTLSVVLASGLYFQQGLEEAEALELTTSTMKLATLAGLDFEQATSLMTSAVRGFHMEMSLGEHVTDVYSELAAHAAASVNDIATAMSRTAAIANSAGMEFETTSAMLTTMIEATQESPETLGTAMKTVVARFTELKNNVSDTESEFEDLDYNKVDKALKSIGVALKDTNGQFRDIDEVFLEVAEKWDTLDRNSLRYVATIAAGSRQQSRFIALMENYDRTLELIETALDSAGRSSELFAKYQDTLENKVNRLRNSWEQLKLSFISSDMFKGGVDVLNKFITNIGKIDKKRLAAIGVIGITAGKAIVINFINLIKNSALLFASAGLSISNYIALGIEEHSPLNNWINKTKAEVSSAAMEIGALLEEALVKPGVEANAEVLELLGTYAKLIIELNLVEKELDDNIKKEKLLTIEVLKRVLEEKMAANGLNVALVEYVTTLYINKGLADNLTSAMNKNAFASSIGPAISSGVSSAVTTGLIMGLSGADFKDTLKTAGISAVTSVAPMILNSALPIIGKWITTIAAPAIGSALVAAAPVLVPVALVTAIVGGITYAFYKIGEYYDDVNVKKRELEAALKTLDVVSKNVDKKRSEADTSATELKGLKEIKEKYEELSSIKYKTTEQLEEYNKLVDTLKTDYPNLIDYYNEETNELKLQNELLDKKIKKLSALVELLNLEATIAEINTEKAQYDVDIAEKELRIAEIEKELGKVKTPDNYRELQDELASLREEAKSLKAELSDIIKERLISNAEGTYGISKALATDLDDIAEHAIDNITEKQARKALSIRKGYFLNTKFWSGPFGLKNQERKILKEAFNVESDEEAKELYNELIKTTEGLELLLKKYTDTLNSKDTAKQIKELYSNLTDIQIEEYDNFKLNIKDLSYNEAIKELNLLDLPEELNAEMQKDLKIELKNKEQIVTGKNQDYLNISGLLGLNQKETDNVIKNWSENSIIALNDALSNIIENTGKEQYAEEYASKLKDLFNSNNIDISDMSLVLNTVDFSLANATNWEKFKKDSIKQLKDLDIKGLGEQEAAKFFEGWSEIALKAKLFSTGFSGTTELIAYESLIDEISNAFIEKLSDFEKFFSTPNEFIKATLSDVKELESLLSDLAESGIEIEDTSNYWDIDADGLIVINAEKMRDLYLDNLLLLSQQTKEKYKQAKLDLQETKRLYEDALKAYDIAKQSGSGELMLKYSNIVSDLQIKLEGYEGLEEEYKDAEDHINEIVEAHKKWVKESSKIDYSSVVSDVKTLSSAYKTLTDEMRENGYVTSDSITSLDTALTALKTSATTIGLAMENGFKNAADFLVDTEDGIKLNRKALEEYVDEMIAAIEAELKGKGMLSSENAILLLLLKAMKAEWGELKQAVIDANKDAWDTYNDNVKSKYEEWQEALDTVKEKEEAVAEAEEKVREAEEKLLETLEKLQESYYGTAYHKNKTDFLYNYNTELELLEKRLSTAKDALDDLLPDDNAHEKVQEYIDALREEITVYKALNEVIKQYIENLKLMLDSKLSERLEQLKAEGAVDTSTNVSDFYYERNGRFYIDYLKLNAAKLPDDIADFIEEQVENMNNYAKAYEENLDKISDAEKEFRERQKKARDEYLNTENKVVELLKKKDLEELDSLKEKYNGMKEANDEYTDALEKSIKKLRDLRNLANQWDDLAEKEKKLSLQLRDTSGANAKDIKKTLEDIAKTRESLLDSAVDNIINNLKELYEEQEETRQAEIEYRLAILDNKNYVDEATAIINNWGSVEEAKAWFMLFDEEFINASDATIDKLLEDYEGYYNNTVMYNEWMSRSYEEVTNLTAEEILEKTRETSETLTSETDRALDEIMEEVHEALELGRKDVEEAKKAVEKAKEAVVEAVNEVSTAMEEARKKWLDYQETLKEPPYTEPPYIEPEQKDDRTDTLKAESVVQAAFKLMGGRDSNGNGKQSFSFNLLAQATNLSIEEAKDFLLRALHGIVTDGNLVSIFKSKEAAQLHFDGLPNDLKGRKYIFKTGGLVDYTGPAWVDGTPSNPEAFLSATDTRLIREFIDLATLQLNPSEYQNNITSNHTIGDLAFNININVESISSDYDVDQMIERMHEDILSITNEPGSSVMLHK